MDVFPGDGSFEARIRASCRRFFHTVRMRRKEDDDENEDDGSWRDGRAQKSAHSPLPSPAGERENFRQIVDLTRSRLTSL